MYIACSAVAHAHATKTPVIQDMYRQIQIVKWFYCYVPFCIFSCEITSISQIACSNLSRNFCNAPTDFFNNGGFRRKTFVFISDNIESRFDDFMSSFSNSCSSSEFRVFY